MMKRISNNRVGYHITTRSEFITNTGSMYGQKLGDNGFVVYSYGPHFPLSFHNGKFWLLNTERYTQTTSKQSGICREACVDWVGCDKAFIINAIATAENQQ